MNYQELDPIVEKTSLEDYYEGLTFPEKLDSYKLIDYKYSSESS
ncbi:hypothetical protein HSIEG1_2523 [Enterococcus sp. HSIEG1]|nr:hypothetical protein HSIEG1_2523 [Enterococcus sp. HSIEG1]